MIQWPPSPIVEDEQSSLAKEHHLNSDSKISETTDDQCVPSRGSIDQFPIILDSDLSRTVALATAPSTPPKTSKNLKVAIPVPEDFGLPTPPPSDNETRGRARVDELRNTKADVQKEPRSKSCDLMHNINRSETRPAMARLHTDTSGGLNSIKTGNLRTPSPYPYQPESGSMRVESARSTDVQFLSPACATNSPVSILTPPSHSDPISCRKDRDSSTDSVRRPKKITRFSDVPLGPGSSYGTPREPSVSPNRFPESRYVHSVYDFEQTHIEPPACRSMNHDPSGYGSQEIARVPRSASRPSRSASKTRDPQSISSTSVEDKTRDMYHCLPMQRPVPPPRVTRPAEKLSLIDFSRQKPTHNKPDSQEDNFAKHTYFVRDNQYSMTPPSVTTPKHMEDYFSQAFERNSQKGPRYTSRLSFDGSMVLSPPSSPPRTPKSEKSSKIYVVSPPTSPRRLSRQSRLPSWDENQFIELKAPKSLLSQATAAATIAAKTSPTDSRSSPTTIDTNLSRSTRSSVPKSRSRPPSPVRESRSGSARRYPSLPPSSRSSMTESASRTETLSPNTYQPTRSVTLNSYEPHSRSQASPVAPPLHYVNSVPTPLPSPLRTAPPIYGPQSTYTQKAPNVIPSQFVLPRCPRSRPLPGLQDWTMIKGIQGIRICPTCAKALSNTKYYKFLERSIYDREEHSIECGMSKSWIRIAFMQSLNQNKPDLKFVEEVVRISIQYHPCPGSNKEHRRWYSVLDPAYNTSISNFFVCSACVRTIDKVFPDLPNYFQRSGKVTERSCNFHTDSRDFVTLTEQLDLVAQTCRERGKSGVDRANPFVCSVYHITHRPVCAREKLLNDHTWYFMDDLPEFTVCAACFDEIILPLGNRPIVRNISRAPRSASSISIPGVATARDGSQPVSCQLYGDNMRRCLIDAVDGLISYETFKAKAKERFKTQWLLSQTNKRYEENQRTVESLKAEVERKTRYWRLVE